MIACQLQPLERWPQTPTPIRKNGTFRVQYAALLDDLDTELDKLKASDVVLEISIPRVNIRNAARGYDGWPKSDARPTHPGIILYFEGRYGPQRYACDTYKDWKDNLRAISLTLERLRDIERYGATRGGQQYAGYAPLPPAPKEGTSPSADAPGSVRATKQERDAAEVLILAAGKGTVYSILATEPGFREIYLEAVQRHHPDRGGSHDYFVRLQNAADLLKRRFVQ